MMAHLDTIVIGSVSPNCRVHLGRDANEGSGEEKIRGIGKLNYQGRPAAAPNLGRAAGHVHGRAQSTGQLARALNLLRLHARGRYFIPIF